MLLGMRSDMLSIKYFTNYLKALEKMGVPKELVDIFARVYTTKENVNPYELLDGLLPFLKDDGPKKIKKLIL